MRTQQVNKIPLQRTDSTYVTPEWKQESVNHVKTEDSMQEEIPTHVSEQDLRTQEYNARTKILFKGTFQGKEGTFFFDYIRAKKDNTQYIVLKSFETNGVVQWIRME